MTRRPFPPRAHARSGDTSARPDTARATDGGAAAGRWLLAVGRGQGQPLSGGRGQGEGQDSREPRGLTQPSCVGSRVQAAAGVRTARPLRTGEPYRQWVLIWHPAKISAGVSGNWLCGPDALGHTEVYKGLRGELGRESARRVSLEKLAVTSAPPPPPGAGGDPHGGHSAGVSLPWEPEGTSPGRLTWRQPCAQSLPE